MNLQGLPRAEGPPPVALAPLPPYDLRQGASLANQPARVLVRGIRPTSLVRPSGSLPSRVTLEAFPSDGQAAIGGRDRGFNYVLVQRRADSQMNSPAA